MTFNNIFPLVLFVFCFSCKEQRIQTLGNEKEFVKNYTGLRVSNDSLILHSLNGLVFYRGEPYFGVGETYYDNGRLALSITYVDGKKNGSYQKWFEDGQISFNSYYKNGRMDGVTKSWWKNGNIRSKHNYVNGKTEGFQLQWYKSGELFKKMNMKDGKEEGMQQSWRENGKIYNNYEARNGRIFGLKKASLCFELEDENLKIKENE